MKFKTETRKRWVDTTIGGKTQRTQEVYTVRVPVAPRDWDQISTKVGVGLVGLLTLVSIVWSTVSIGGLLGGGIGFAAAAMFDISWAVCLILEWKARFDPGKRSFPRNLGWLLLIATMFFIGWHGVDRDDVALAVVGASVSLFAKVLWLGLMRHVDRSLSPEHLAWVKATISEANAKMAVAEVMRQAARLEQRALAEHLALESARDLVSGPREVVEQVTTPEPKRIATPEPKKITRRLKVDVEPAPEAGTVETDMSVFRSKFNRHHSVVYFVQNGNRVKIGTTKLLKARIEKLTLRMSDVVRVEYGTRQYERQLHARFADLRVGDTEWFELTGALAEYLGYEAPAPVTTLLVPPRTTPVPVQSTTRTPVIYEGSTIPGYEGSTITKAEAVDILVKLIREGNSPSYSEAEKMFGRPRQTVIGWVKAARAKADDGTGLYL